jgi:dolichol kinase
VAGALTFVELPRSVSLTVLGVILTLLTAVDLVRLRLPEANRLFFRLFTALASPRERRGFASSTWYALGLLLTVFLFPTREAVSAVLVLALADPLASVVGQRLGKHPFLGGSMEGSATFVAVALAILVPRHPLPAAGGAALIAALVERRGWPLDDNLAIPLATGLVLSGARLLLG